MKQVATHKQDFSKLPELQPAYMKAGAHDIAKAMADLRASVKGFLVEMPLDWANNESATPRFPGNMSQSVAQNETPKNEEVMG